MLKNKVYKFLPEELEEVAALYDGKIYHSIDLDYKTVTQSDIDLGREHTVLDFPIDQIISDLKENGKNGKGLVDDLNEVFYYKDDHFLAGQYCKTTECYYDFKQVDVDYVVTMLMHNYADQNDTYSYSGIYIDSEYFRI